MMGWTVVHPLNTLSVRMNLAIASNDQSTKRLLPFFTNILRKEGIRSLYRGLSAGLMRQIFYSTSVFGFFEVIRDRIAKYREVDFITRAAAGICSGGMFVSPDIFRC